MPGTVPAIAAPSMFETFVAELAPVRALRGADLVVMPGKFVAVMGPSGCGESTLLTLIAGLGQADEGEIEISGERVTGKNADELGGRSRWRTGRSGSSVGGARCRA